MHGLICLAMILLACVPLAGQEPESDLVLEIVEYRISDASASLVQKYDQATDDVDALLLFAEVQPRLALSIPAPPGKELPVEEGRVSGWVSVKPADEGMFEVTLRLDRFLKGSPLLIAPCRPHVVGRFKVRVQGRTQLTLRAIRVDTGHARCDSPGSLLSRAQPR